MDCSQIFIFGPPDFFADFVAGFFSSFLWGKSAHKNPPGKFPAKSSKIYTTKILDISGPPCGFTPANLELHMGASCQVEKSSPKLHCILPICNFKFQIEFQIKFHQKFHKHTSAGSALRVAFFTTKVGIIKVWGGLMLENCWRPDKREERLCLLLLICQIPLTQPKRGIFKSEQTLEVLQVIVPSDRLEEPHPRPCGVFSSGLFKRKETSDVQDVSGLEHLF